MSNIVKHAKSMKENIEKVEMAFAEIIEYFTSNVECLSLSKIINSFDSLMTNV